MRSFYTQSDILAPMYSIKEVFKVNHYTYCTPQQHISQATVLLLETFLNGFTATHRLQGFRIFKYRKYSEVEELNKNLKIQDTF